MELYKMKTNANSPVNPVYLESEKYAYSLTKENFMKMPESSAGYYEYKNTVVIPDVMMAPTYMVSNLIKDTISIYDSSIVFKNIILLPNNEDDLNKGVQMFNIPNLPRINCLSEESVILPNGAVKEVLLDEAKIQNKDIFMIDNVVENIVIVSLRLMESILRRNVFGVKFERVKILGRQ